MAFTSCCGHHLTGFWDVLSRFRPEAVKIASCEFWQIITGKLCTYVSQQSSVALYVCMYVRMYVHMYVCMLAGLPPHTEVLSRSRVVTRLPSQILGDALSNWKKSTRQQDTEHLLTKHQFTQKCWDQHHYSGALMVEYRVFYHVPTWQKLVGVKQRGDSFTICHSSFQTDHSTELRFC